jgi:excisionase family DNA binding protein
MNEEVQQMDQSFRPVDDPILTIPEVARYLKVSKSKVYELVSKKEIPHLKIGRNVRIRQIDLQVWVEKQSTQIAFGGLPKH